MQLCAPWSVPDNTCVVFIIVISDAAKLVTEMLLLHSDFA